MTGFTCKIPEYMFPSSYIDPSDANACFSGIWFHGVCNATLEGLTVVVNSSSAPGLILMNVTNVNLKSVTVYSLQNRSLSGIRVQRSRNVSLHSSHVYNCSMGYMILNTNNVHLSNIVAGYNTIGIKLVDLINIIIEDTIVTHNYAEGIAGNRLTNIHVRNTTATYNNGTGIQLHYYMRSISITNTTSAFNDQGINILHVLSGTSVSDTVVKHNTWDGFRLVMSIGSTHITRIAAVHNQYHGIHIANAKNTFITNVRSEYNIQSGLRLYNMNNTHISNAIVSENKNGTYLNSMFNTSIANSTFSHTHGKETGLNLEFMKDTLVVNCDFIHNGKHGMYITDMQNTRIFNVNVSLNQKHGIFLLISSGAHLVNITSAYNSEIGMALREVTHIDIDNAVLIHNDDIGLTIYVCKIIHICNVTVTQNVKKSSLLNGQITASLSSNILIDNSNFTDVSSLNSLIAVVFYKLPAIIALYESDLQIRESSFKENHLTSIRAHASNITLSGLLTFVNNSALSGTVFSFFQDSVLHLTETSRTYFLNNHATNSGGVFYVSNNEHVVVGAVKTVCFFDTSDVSTPQIRFTFVNNSAGKGGDVLYGGEIALATDGNWNCLKRFKNISNLTSQNTLSQISSDPMRVCLCNQTGLPDCMILTDPSPRVIYPGETIGVSSVVVGQTFGRVAGSVYAQFSHAPTTESKLPSGQEVQSIGRYQCKVLKYTIMPWRKMSKVVLILTVHNIYVSEVFTRDNTEDLEEWWPSSYGTSNAGQVFFSSNPVSISISLLPCPPGFTTMSQPPFRCDCGELVGQMPGVQCFIQDQTISRSELVWVGMIGSDGRADGIVAASQNCPLNYCISDNVSVTLDQPDSQCSYNHSGILCGGCQPGLSLVLGSEQCQNCSNYHLALLILFMLAGPILVGFIKILDLTISQGTLNGLVFYANMIQANRYIFIPPMWTHMHPLAIFIAWLNLDFGVEVCLFQGLTAYSKTWLQFVFPFYIWCIAGLIILLSSRSNRVARMMGNNSVPVLATLFLLSYAKLFRTIITALSYTILYTSQGSKAVWTADGNVDYLGAKHGPLFALALAVLLFLWLPYTLLLFLGQWLHMCKIKWMVRMLMKMKPFLDAHHGPLKGKHRYWFGALLLTRAVILLISALVPANTGAIVILCVAISGIVFLYFGQIVYRNVAVSMFDISFFANLILLSLSTLYNSKAGSNTSVAAYISIGTAFLLFVGLAIFKLMHILKRTKRMKECFQKKKDDELDDWELYEQAAILREMEYDVKGRTTESSQFSGSLESVLTY